MSGNTGATRTVATGDLVVDTKSGTLARVMATGPTVLSLRPPRGGVEWDVPTDRVRPATTAEELAEQMRVRGLLSRPESEAAR